MLRQHFAGEWVCVSHLSSLFVLMQPSIISFTSGIATLSKLPGFTPCTHRKETSGDEEPFREGHTPTLTLSRLKCNTHTSTFIVFRPIQVTFTHSHQCSFYIVFLDLLIKHTYAHFISWLMRNQFNLFREMCLPFLAGLGLMSVWVEQRHYSSEV